MALAHGRSGQISNRQVICVRVGRYLDGHEDDAGVNYAQIDEESDWDDDELVAERHRDAEEAYFNDI